MTRKEKLFFRRTSKEAGGIKDPLYMKLFDVIAGQKTCNDAQLLKKLGPALHKKNLAYQKHYLHSQLNECLVAYTNRDNPEQQIYKNIQLIRINRKKGLLNEALALWEKTIKKAREMELFSMSQLLKREFEKMILFSSFRIRYDDLHTLFRSNIMTYDEYAEMITLRDLYAEILMLKRKAHFDFDEELKQAILELRHRLDTRRQGLQSPSFWYRHYTRMCHATLSYLSTDSQSALPLVKQAVTDWWENQRFIESDMEYYLELLYMVNYTGIMQGAYDYVEFVFNHPVNRLIREETQQAHFEALKYLALNKVYNKMARYTEVKALLEKMKTRYTRLEPLLSAELNRTLCFSMGIACFVLDQSTASLQFIKRGVTYFKDGTREEQFIFANLFLLLLLYNMNNIKLFDAQYKSTYSYFYKKTRPRTALKKDTAYSFGKTLMHCLHDTFYLSSFKEKSHLFRKAVEELDATPPGEVQQQILNIFNFRGWLISQVQRISYQEYVQRNYKATAAPSG